MLVLSRKSGEEILIGGNVRVRVLEVRGNRVRLGFTAPETVEIQRAELVVSGSPALPSEDRGATVTASAGRSNLLLPSA